MFSEQLQTIDGASSNRLWVVAGLMVIACQLVAFTLVANGQVQKAELREARYASERLAVAQCLESSAGSARHNCMLQARADAMIDALPASSTSRQVARSDRDFSSLPQVPVMKSMMPVAFASN